MSSHRNLHLEEDQLIRAVVEESDLPETLREHLSGCPECRAAKKRIEEDLARLGQMAKRLSPSPLRKVSLPSEKSQNAFRWTWQWRVAFGVGAAAVFAVFVMGMPPLFKHTPEESTYTQEMLETEEFMAEVSMLSENALPSVYLDMAGESDPEFYEEFMQFLVPVNEEEPLTYNSGLEGGMAC